MKAQSGKTGVARGGMGKKIKGEKTYPAMRPKPKSGTLRGNAGAAAKKGR
jgi:hypothetical protein